jgi:hypothetical protein
MAKSPIKAIGDKTRPGMLAKSEFTEANPYGLDKTDPVGGSPTSQKARTSMLAKNKFTVDNQYSVDD